MSNIIDACGRACPEPVLLVKKALEGRAGEYTVLVDSRTALGNVTRFAQNAGYTVSVTEDGETFRMLVRKG